MEQYPKDYEEQQAGKHEILKSYIKDEDAVLDLGFAHAPMSHLHNAVLVGIDIEMVKKPDNYSEIISHDLNEGMPNINNGFRFDVVVAADVLEHIQNPCKTIREVYGLLKPGGLFLVTLPNVYNPSEVVVNISGLYRNKLRDLTHLYSFNYNNLANLLEHNGFRILELRGMTFKIPFGKAFFSKRTPLLLSKTTLIVAKSGSYTGGL